MTDPGLLGTHGKMVCRTVSQGLRVQEHGNCFRMWKYKVVFRAGGSNYTLCYTLYYKKS